MYHGKRRTGATGSEVYMAWNSQAPAQPCRQSETYTGPSTPTTTYPVKVVPGGVTNQAIRTGPSVRESTTAATMAGQRHSPGRSADRRVGAASGTGSGRASATFRGPATTEPRGGGPSLGRAASSPP